MKDLCTTLCPTCQALLPQRWAEQHDEGEGDLDEVLEHILRRAQLSTEGLGAPELQPGVCEGEFLLEYYWRLDWKICEVLLYCNVSLC